VRRTVICGGDTGTCGSQLGIFADNSEAIGARVLSSLGQTIRGSMALRSFSRAPLAARFFGLVLQGVASMASCLDAPLPATMVR
jgi:hypothetical protein